MPSSLRSLGVWPLVAAALALFVVASSTEPVSLWTNPNPEPAAPVVRTDDERPPPREVPEQDNADLPSGVSTGLQVIGWALVALLGGAALYAARNLYWWVPLRRVALRWIPRLSFPEPLPEVAAPVLDVDADAAFAALFEGEPRNAIVACWMRLEADASAMGFGRDPAETSAEYVERVVQAASVAPEPIAELAAMYREARFSSHELADTHRQAASAVLTEVIAALRTSEAVEV